jgi:hypothetical protein
MQWMVKWMLIDDMIYVYVHVMCECRNAHVMLE